jgi:hypothetical protein
MLAFELFPLSTTIVTLSTLTELFFNLFNRFLAQIFPVVAKNLAREFFRRNPQNEKRISGQFFAIGERSST